MHEYQVSTVDINLSTISSVNMLAADHLIATLLKSQPYIRAVTDSRFEFWGVLMLKNLSF